ncbi:MAG: cupin domain-containing protein [Treponema sp.]|nr:cupin domain-containing protein [Treponema sp.]
MKTKAMFVAAVAVLAVGGVAFTKSTGAKKMKKTTVTAKNIENYTKKSMFPTGVPNNGFAQYFSGKSFLAMLNSEDAFIANVTFEPGCVNNWHVHHGEAQILVGVGGRGWVQFDGQDALPINEGDVVRVPPEVKHWHGAAKDSWFSHLSISVKSGSGGAAGTDWLEAVDRSEYDKLR